MIGLVKRMVWLIDGSNTFATCQRMGWYIDYKLLYKLRNDAEIWGRGCDLVSAFYFTSIPPKEEQSKVRELADWLDFNYYSTITKPTREFHDRETGRIRIKGNMDIEIAITAMRAAQAKIDHVVLFTGDEDFLCLVNELKSMFVRVTIVSSKETRPSMVGEGLRKAADRFIELMDLEQKIRRRNVSL